MNSFKIKISTIYVQAQYIAPPRLTTLWLCWLLMPFSILAQIRVTASVSENTVALDGTLIYTVEVKASGQLPSISYLPTPPEAQGFRLVEDRPNVAQGSIYANGKAEQTTSFSWYYRPLKAGDGYIGRTTVVVGKETFSTMPISVRITGSDSKPQQPQFRSRSLFDDPYDPNSTNRPQAAAPPQPKPKFGNGEVFIKAFPSTTNVYQGDQVYIQYYLYIPNTVRIENARLADSWDAPGFWKEELPDIQGGSGEVINGISYRKVLAKRVVVFPSQAGALKIDPLQIQGDASRTNLDDPFDTFFGSPNPATSPITISSQPVSITSRALPSGAPRAFSGAVGQFNMNSMIDKSQVEVGTPVTITVAITGVGNVATMIPPVLEVPSSMEKYDPELKDEIIRETTVSGIKTFKFTLIPRENGTYTIPPIEFSYFDPQTSSYKTLKSEAYSLKVTGENQPIKTTKGKFPAKDIAPLMQGKITWQKAQTSKPLSQNPLTWIALTLPLLGLGGLFLYRKQADRLETDIEYARRRKSDPMAKKHLKKAQQLLDTSQGKAFYQEIHHAVLGFIGNRLNIAEQGLTAQLLREKLSEKNIPETLQHDLKSLLDTCDAVRFSPIQPTPETMRQSLQQAENLITELDKKV